MCSAARPAGPVRCPQADAGVIRSAPHVASKGCRMGSVVKKRRKRMAKKKHRKLLRKTRVQRRRLGK
ncbi:hypothetical protein Sar04_07610 [Salinispora arenicola]|uniref:Ribosomal protein mS38 C-terminal domain-containing protein n=2 Tax=Salinispora arenicola TaxID=168697 RepID=A0ABQ4JM27_SALAC|nr:hypothetical protein Sar04_07610 [Salinispora arenicola]